MSVLVFAENPDGKFKKSAFEIVSYACAVAGKLNTSLTALSVGSATDDELKKLAAYGASKILSAANDKLNSFNVQAYASVIAEAAKSESSKVVILSSSFSGKALAPRVAVRLEAGLAENAVELPATDSGFVVKKGAFSGKAIAHVELLSDVKVISVMPNSYKVVERSAAPVINTMNPSISDKDLSVTVRETVRASGKISLPEAEIVVSGGRGLKGPENWGMVEELAKILGAATACSKPVSDAGWRPHSEHVGQTGIAISPNLYIAIGISGAIQHLAGVSSSKVIVVVNKDPEAPFFKAADYGIAGDAFEVVPKLVESAKAFMAGRH